MSQLFNSCYNALLGLSLCVLFLRLVVQKRMRGRDFAYFKARFGKKIPPILPGKAVIWVHAPSLGEMKAAFQFIHLLCEERKDAQILVSTTTLVGLEAAKKELPDVQAHFLLPLDFSWIMKRWVRVLQPELLILVEGDLWYQLITAIKDAGGKVILINGKISERSYQRYCLFSFFAKKVFSQISYFCVQSKRYADRFLKLGVPGDRIHVTGNLKFDASVERMGPEDVVEWRDQLRLSASDLVVVIGSTHQGEEKELLLALAPLFEVFTSLKIIVVPRRPERFESVFGQLQKLDFVVGRYSERSSFTGKERVILMDVMGVLARCYEIATLAIVAGSFSSEVGGHNILEPVLVGVPVLFGPAMQTQEDLKELVLESGAGLSVLVENVKEVVEDLLEDSQRRDQYKQACEALASRIAGASQKTLKAALSRP